MYDGAKIVSGLAVFVLVCAFPLWYSAAKGGAGDLPELTLPEGGGGCVESTEHMRASHMELLNHWRDQVVRHGERRYRGPDGVEHEMSLSKTCLGCHTSKAEFCDRCHDAVNLVPDCFECHFYP